jgi:hypothetical protein
MEKVITENTEFVVLIPYTDSWGNGETGVREVERKEGDVVKASETQNVKFLLENNIIAFKITEDSFDFSNSWEELDWDEKADFLSFTGTKFLCDANRDEVIGMWTYYQMKNNMEV